MRNSLRNWVILIHQFVPLVLDRRPSIIVFCFAPVSIEYGSIFYRSFLSFWATLLYAIRYSFSFFSGPPVMIRGLDLRATSSRPFCTESSFATLWVFPGFCTVQNGLVKFHFTT